MRKRGEMSESMNREAKLVCAGAMAQARWPDVMEKPTRVYVTDSPDVLIMVGAVVRPTLPRGYADPIMDTRGPLLVPLEAREEIPWYTIGFPDGDWIGVGWDPELQILLVVEPKE